MSANASTSPPSTFHTKRTDFAALQHLLLRGEDVAKHDKQAGLEVKRLVGEIERILGVSPRNASDRYRYSVEGKLQEIIEIGMDHAGIERKRGPSAYSDDVEKSPKYARYLEVVKSKGTFEGLTEGSPEYKEKLDKVKQAFIEKFGGGAAANNNSQAKPTTEVSPAEAEKLAEQKKTEGNNKLNAGDYEGAVTSYNEAIELCRRGPNSHLFFANRAAAYINMKEYQLAADDCLEAIEIKPEYAKAHARLAQCWFSLNRPLDAETAARKALSYEPGNANAASILDRLASGEGGEGGGSGNSATTAESKPSSSSSSQMAMPPGMGAPGGGGMPDLASMAAMLGGGGGGGGRGGPDLASMMNNPMMSQMMRDPAMMQMAQQMMSDPNAMNNMMQMLGGGAGRGGRR